MQTPMDIYRRQISAINHAQAAAEAERKHVAPARINVLQIFYDCYCGTNGIAPTCNGCPEWRRMPGGDPVCIHPEHPENKLAYREMKSMTHAART